METISVKRHIWHASAAAQPSIAHTFSRPFVSIPYWIYIHCDVGARLEAYGRCGDANCHAKAPVMRRVDSRGM